MNSAESLEEYCKINVAEDSWNKAVENTPFSILSLHDFKNPYQINYRRRDFYKICLVTGPTIFHFGNQVVQLDGNFLVFCNPLTPYSCEAIGDHNSGYACLFKQDFFDHDHKIKEYPLFKATEIPAFKLSDEQLKKLSRVYEKMFEELESDFVYKFDVIRSLILELVYHGLKMVDTPTCSNDSNGALRLASLFNELLETQFPFENSRQKMNRRFPVDFACQLAVHVNHLNRSLKEVTGKTTSKLIAERILMESRILLRRTDWNISEIAWCLGFEELPHFINFFKKRTGITPNTFRKTSTH
jgi:AraC-like DNA-binding protein